MVGNLPAMWTPPYDISGCGSVWLERLVWDQEVAGSNPVTPITTLIPEVRCLCGLRDFCYRKNHPKRWLRCYFASRMILQIKHGYAPNVTKQTKQEL